MNNLPENFLASIQTCAGFHRESFIKANEKDAITSVRLNPKKRISKFNSNKKIPWCDNGYYLNERPQFTLDPLLHAGTYYVQEASSMFLEYALKNSVDENKTLTVLDLCAAPGGKSTLLAGNISENSLLVSNEVINSRISRLKENIIKWGNANIIITNNAPEDFSNLKNIFDVIVVDAPCSGSGLFRKDLNARLSKAAGKALSEWSTENVLACSKRQTRILADVFPALKKDGILIYSTCSYSKEENEDVIEKEIKEHGYEMLNIPAEWNIVKSEFGYRFYPDKVKGEGFFLSVLKKIAEETDDAEFNERRIISASDAERKIIFSWIKPDSNLVFFKINNSIVAIRKAHINKMQHVFSDLKVIKAGITIGEIKGNELIPAHEFALSELINPHIQSIELTEAQSVNYLRKNEMKILTGLKGWTLVKYQDKNLGWIKILPGRINNYYPVEWRIRK